MDDIMEIISKVDKIHTIDLLKSLIRSPSVNPPGEELECAEIVAKGLEKIGVEVELSERDLRRPNVIGKLEGHTGTPTLLFNGHLDVVPAGRRWTYDPFGGEMVGNDLYGRGSVDMKSGLVSMMMAMEALRRGGIDLQGDLVLTAVVDEEAGSVSGTRHLLEEGLRADMAVVGEPTDLRVETANKGILWAEIEVYGRSSHAARPRLGVNAIYEMSRIISKLERKRFEKRNDLFEVPTPTLNVGIIQGGTKVNVVPDYCRIEVDRRLLPGESPTMALREIEEVVKEAELEDPQLDAKLRVIKEWPPMTTSPEEPVVKSLIKAVKAVTLQQPRIVGKAAATDASFLVNIAKIPTVLFGPGDPRMSHTADEHVNIDRVVKAGQILTLVACDLLGG